MAVEKAVATKRQFLFGLKSALDTVLMLAVVALAIWAGTRFGGQTDLSSGAVNSLSPRTLKLLAGLDQDVTITGLYTLIASDVRPFAKKRYDRVADLLDLYDAAGGAHVTTFMIDPEKDPPRLRSLLERIRSKPNFKGQSEPYIKVLDAYPALQAILAPLLKSESDTLAQIIQADPALAQVRELPVIQRNFQIVLEDSQDIERQLKRLRAAELPAYGQAVNLIGRHLDQVLKALQVSEDWMTREGAKLVGAAPASVAFFQGAADRYADAIDQIKKLREQSKQLEPLKLEEVYQQLKAGQVVIVETPDDVAVVPEDDVWPFRTDQTQSADKDPREFAGEQAISSAILHLTQKDRTAVIFVRYGGGPLLTPDLSQMNQFSQRMPQAPYEMIDTAMQKENFLTAEWNVQEQDTPPEVKDAKRKVYVVFPPTPPAPQSLRNPAGAKSISQEQVQAVLNAVGDSGMAMFLVDWRVPSAPFAAPSDKYEYGEYLSQSWGIDVKKSYLTIQFMLNPQKREAFIPRNMQNPMLIDSTAFDWTDQAIAKPLHSLPGGFVAVPPLALHPPDQRPEGVTLETVAVVKDSDSIWAVKDIMRLQNDFREHEGTHRYDDDIAPPFPIAVAGSKPENQRLVVIASTAFVSNQILNMGPLMLVGADLVRAQLFPANRELFINALHWLTGNADRIAVGPRRADVPRLDKLEEGPTADFIKVFLVGIWPGLALLAGAVVWFMRRR